MQWRTLCESDHPELVSPPERGGGSGGVGGGVAGAGDAALVEQALTPLQRLLILRAVRPDRLLQGALLFTGAVLGKK